MRIGLGLRSGLSRRAASLSRRVVFLRAEAQERVRAASTQAQRTRNIVPWLV